MHKDKQGSYCSGGAGRAFHAALLWNTVGCQLFNDHYFFLVPIISKYRVFAVEKGGGEEH